MDFVVHLFICASGQSLPRWKEAFPGARATRPDSPVRDTAKLALVWVRLQPGVPAQQQLAAARAKVGAVPIVALSDAPSDEEATAALTLARGYCNTHANAETLRQVAAVALQGGMWIGESLMQKLLAGVARVQPAGFAPDDWSAELTEREREVAEAVVSGASNKEIAARLGITERTVKAHVGAVLDKLQVRDRLQLVLKINGRVPA